MIPIPLFAVSAPALGVPASDGSALASMALVALVLAAASLAARRLPETGMGRDPRAVDRAARAAASTRARS